jgi:cGMP-dependent protein kinase
MGTAKLLQAQSSRTFTIIGTPHYMAPEIIKSKGYTSAVDLWSIGVCLFEFMCGYVPFGEDAEDPMEIYDCILKNPLKFPNYFKDHKARALILQLVNATPEQRLGLSYAALKANSWFDTFDWVLSSL